MNTPPHGIDLLEVLAGFIFIMIIAQGLSMFFDDGRVYSVVPSPEHPFGLAALYEINHVVFWIVVVGIIILVITIVRMHYGHKASLPFDGVAKHGRTKKPRLGHL